MQESIVSDFESLSAMKLALFTQISKQGGLDTFLVNLIDNWPGNDEIIIFCNASHTGLAKITDKTNCKNINIVYYDYLIAQDIEFKFSRFPWLLRFMIRALFWVFGFPYLIYKSLGLFKKLNPDRLMVINGGYPGGDACLAATIAWRVFNPKRLAWHNFHNLVLPYPASVMRKFKEAAIDFFVASSSAGFVSVSKTCLASLAARPLLSKCAGKYIYNGISSFRPLFQTSIREELSIPENGKLLLLLAVYEPRKGHAFMIKVMEEVIAQFPHAYLLMCGDGSIEEMMYVTSLRDRSMARSNIFVLPHRPDVSNLMAQADVLVMPSQSQESFGYTVVEAMTSLLPVVVTDVGGLPEVIENNVTGFVVKRDDVSGFAEKLRCLLGDDNLRSSMGGMGARRVQEHFLASRMAREYAALLNS